MEVKQFEEIEAEFIQRVHSAVWCAVTTINSANRPRSRVLHPIWEGRLGWIATGRQSHKAKHLAENPYISLTYMKDPLNPVYVDCKAEWVDDSTEKVRIWELFGATPPPLGYDLAPFFGSVDNPGYGLLKLSPWRIELSSLGGEVRVWRA
ncbi:MAG: pyridoxamine 5'-phosphate oxidase family protein [Aggregatilineales bacterium]